MQHMRGVALRAVAAAALAAAGCGVAAQESTCYGTPAEGAIEGAVQLPQEGDNFQIYRWKEARTAPGCIPRCGASWRLRLRAAAFLARPLNRPPAAAAAENPPPSPAFPRKLAA